MNENTTATPPVGRRSPLNKDADMDAAHQFPTSTTTAPAAATNSVERKASTEESSRVTTAVTAVNDSVGFEKKSESSSPAAAMFLQPTLRAGVIRRDGKKSPVSSVNSDREHSLNTTERDTISAYNPTPPPGSDGGFSQVSLISIQLVFDFSMAENSKSIVTILFCHWQVLLKT